jgi:hypothetical protein
MVLLGSKPTLASVFCYGCPVQVQDKKVQSLLTVTA